MRIALSTAFVLSATPRFAAAEVFDPLRGYGFDGSPNNARPQPERGQPERRAAPDQAQAPDAQRRRVAPAYASASTVRRMATREGFHLLDSPKRRGRAFIATAEDGKGHRFRLIFNAYNGQIVDRADIGVADAKAVAPAAVVATKPPEPASKPLAAVAPSAEALSKAAVAIAVAAPLVVAAVPLDKPAITAPAVPAPAPTTPAAVAVATSPAPVAAPVIPTPATPPATYAAVNPCEVPQHASTAAAPQPVEMPKLSVAAIPAPSITEPAIIKPMIVDKAPVGMAPSIPVTAAPAETTFDATNAHSPPEPYSAPTPIYGEGSETSPVQTTAVATEPMITGSPPEPYKAPTPDEANQALATENAMPPTESATPSVQLKENGAKP